MNMESIVYILILLVLSLLCYRWGGLQSSLSIEKERTKRKEIEKEIALIKKEQAQIEQRELTKRAKFKNNKG